MTGQFVVLEFDNARPIAYTEVQDGAMYVQHPGEVDTYRESARSVEEVGLPPEESIRFVADLIKKLRGATFMLRKAPYGKSVTFLVRRGRCDHVVPK